MLARTEHARRTIQSLLRSWLLPLRVRFGRHDTEETRYLRRVVSDAELLDEVIARLEKARTSQEK